MSKSPESASESNPDLNFDSPPDEFGSRVLDSGVAPGAGGATVEPGLLRYVQLAVADLQSRLNVAETQIEVLSAESKSWPNAAMGCVRPGMRYIQVPQDGTLIRLRVGKKTFRYHSGGSKTPFLCE